MKRTTSINLILQLPENCACKQRAIYTALREAIIAGMIGLNQRLPSTRDLAAALDMSRGTAVIAYEMLQAEGYLVSRRGAGTFVAATLPDDRLVMPKTGLQVASPPRRAEERGRGAAEALSHRGCHFVSTTLVSHNAADRPRPFIPYLPALAEFPANLWARLTARHARLIKPRLLDRGHAAGWLRLRTAVAEYVRSTRGIYCHCEQIILTSSTLQSLSLCSRLLTEQGDQVLMEDPGYGGALAALRAAGLMVIPVPVDAQGMQVGADDHFGGRARLAYVTPAHQRPTGVVMSTGRRQDLLDWAVRHDAWVFEDDDQSEFRYYGQPTPALYAMDRRGCVLYSGSFDKTLFPALCISYLVVPPSLVDAFTRAQAIFGGHPTIVSQVVLCDFMESGHFIRHIRRAAGQIDRDQTSTIRPRTRRLVERRTRHKHRG
jgi:GntR family transcriptional regulator/MocR family aminotransferase